MKQKFDPGSPPQCIPTQLSVVREMRCVDPKCKNPQCRLFYMNQRCHPHTPTETFINTLDGTMTVACKTCHTPMITVRIA